MINTLHLGLSYNCNMRCKHCFVNKQNNQLDFNVLKKYIDVLEENGLFFVIYTFGEPLLADNFWTVSKYISSKKIVQTIMTNGSLINSSVISKLKDNDINNIYVSLDSVDSKKHDENRNYKGSYTKAISSLKLLVNNDFNVGMAVTINDDNVLEMNQFVELAQEIGVKNISFLRQRCGGKLIDLKNKLLYEKFYETYLCGERKINILFHDPTLLKITKKLYDLGKISLNVYEKYMDMNSCHNSTTLSIEPSGNIKNCNLINNSIGNISKDNVMAILKKGCGKNECVSNCS